MYQIDRFGRTPIYEQIIEQTELLVASGTLTPGDQLPSVRALSQELSANPNTLQKAYAELERRGVATSAPGSGRFVSKEAPRIVSERMNALLRDVTALCVRLRDSGVEKRLALEAVETAYAGCEPASTKDAAQTACGKEAEL